MSNTRWVDDLMPDQPLWIRDLVDEELVKRDAKIQRLRGQLENCIGHLEQAKNKTFRKGLPDYFLARKASKPACLYSEVIENANIALYETLK